MSPARRRSRHTRPRPRRRTLAAPALVLAAVALVLAGPGAQVPRAEAQTSFTFRGSGWGHGVGMSQWGARGMAANGSSHTQILGHYYTGVSVVSQPVSNDLRVLIAEKAPSVTLRTGGRTTFEGIGVVGGAGQTVTVSRSGGSLRLTGAVNATSAGPIDVRFAPDGVLQVTPGDGYRYGQLRLTADPGGGVRAVLRDLSMQQYLYGLGEMPSSWPAAALRAQAVAGRTFAQKRRNERGAKDFDLYPGVIHQAYTGTRHEAPSWNAAVDSTAGQVVTYPGHGLIDAVYSASSGGHTEHSEIVWVSQVPYLRARPDPHDGSGGNPHASWTRTYAGTQLGSWFGIGTVTSVRIVGGVGPSGRVDKATIRLVGTGGTRDVNGASFRSTVNARTSQRLMSTRFTVDGHTSPATTMATGSWTHHHAEGRTVVVGGTSVDPDGHPLVRVVSTMGSQRATRTHRSTNGHWLMAWQGDPGTRRVCATVIDEPTRQEVSLGCRDIVVK